MGYVGGMYGECKVMLGYRVCMGAVEKSWGHKSGGGGGGGQMFLLILKLKLLLSFLLL